MMHPLVRSFLAPLLVASLLVTSSRARADDPTEPPDTVVLKDGGKLRGRVVEEDPKRGVTVQLLDGTTRKIAKATLDHVEYAPVVPPAPIAVAPPPVLYAIAPPIIPTPEPTHRRSKGLMITGLVLMPIGAVALGAGIPYYVNASKTNNSGNINTGCDQNGICGSTSESFHDSTGQSIATGMMIVGGLVLATGLIFTLVGASKTPGSDEASLSPILSRASSTSGVTVDADVSGLTLRF